MSTEVKKIESAEDEKYLIPLADIFETENDYTLKLEMPGVIKDNLEIVIDNNELRIKGITEKNELSDKDTKYSEFTLDNYFRKFIVGNDIDKNKIDANLEDGVLTIVLHKSEEVKPRKIEIKVN
jgi:HSP20 family protein